LLRRRERMSPKVSSRRMWIWSSFGRAKNSATTLFLLLNQLLAKSFTKLGGAHGTEGWLDSSSSLGFSDPDFVTLNGNPNFTGPLLDEDAILDLLRSKKAALLFLPPPLASSCSVSGEIALPRRNFPASFATVDFRL